MASAGLRCYPRRPRRRVGGCDLEIQGRGSPQILGSVVPLLEEAQPALAPRPSCSRPLDPILATMPGGSPRRRLRLLLLHSVSPSSRLLDMEMVGFSRYFGLYWL